MQNLFKKLIQRSNHRWVAGLSVAALIVGASAAEFSLKKVGKTSSSKPVANRVDTAKVKAGLINLPLVFEENRGQTDSQAKFLARAKGYTAFMTPSETVLRIKDGTVMRMKLQNANTSPKLRGEDRKASISNYYIGSDPSKWLEKVPHYGKVRYEGVYSGIDAVYSGNERYLEYNFEVKPGSDPNRIRMAFEGASSVAINQEGDLEVASAQGTSVNHKPVIYQQVRGQRKLVNGEFVMLAKNEVGFHIGEYDRSKALVIDPTLQVWAFLGGTGNDEGAAIAATNTTNQGNAPGVFITGRTASPSMPGPGGTRVSNGTNWDVFVTGLNAGTPGVLDNAGSTIAFTTYIGGTGDDAGRGIAVDNRPAGNVYVAGYTNSINFPATLGNGAVAQNYDAFVLKLSLSGTGPVAITYGGPGADQALSIALDYSTGNATATSAIANGVVSAITIGSKGNSYVSTPHVTLVGGGGAGATATATITGGQVSAITIINGGAGYVRAPAVTIDTPGLIIGSPAQASINPSITPNIVIGGLTSGNLPAPLAVDCQQDHTPCGNDGSPVFYRGGDTDGFIAKFTNALVPLTATYLGSSGTDQVNGVAVDLSGNVYATGFTTVNPPVNLPNADGVKIQNPAYGFPVVNGLTDDPNCGGLKNELIHGPGSSGPVFQDNGRLDPATQPNSATQPNAGCRDAVPGANRRRVAFVAKFSGAGGTGTASDLNFLANSALFGVGSLATSCDTSVGQSPHCDAGFGIAVDLNIVPDTVAPPIFNDGTFVEPLSKLSSRMGHKPPPPDQVPEGYEPGVAGPRVYVVGTTANHGFATTLGAMADDGGGGGGGGAAVAAIIGPTCVNIGTCPAPTLSGVPVRGLDAGLATQSGQSQGWLVAFQFPTATYPFNPNVIPVYVVLQPPTCNGQDTCQQGSGIGVTARRPLGPEAPYGSWNAVAVDSGQQAYVIGQMGMSPNCISAASTGCISGAERTANSGEFGTGVPDHLALEMERIDRNGVPEPIFGLATATPDPGPPRLFPCDSAGVNGPACVAPSVTTPNTSFVIDTGLGVLGSNYGQFDGPPPPTPNGPNGLGNGIAVNGLREAFFVGTTTAFVPSSAVPAGVRACGTAGTLCGPATIDNTGHINNATIIVSNAGVACAAVNTGRCQGSGYTTAPTCTITPVTPAPNATCTTTIASAALGGGVTSILFQNVLASQFSSPPTITIAAAPSAIPVGTVSGGFGLVSTPRIPPVNPPVPATINILGGGGLGNNASVTGLGIEDVLYGAIQFYDGMATPEVLNFSGTVRGPGQLFDFPIPPPQNVTFFNWEGDQLTIPPGCTITPTMTPDGIFTLDHRSNTAVWALIPVPAAMENPGVRTVTIDFAPAGPCSGIPGVPLDEMDSIQATLTVFAPLDLSPTQTFVLHSPLGSGIITEYQAEGFQLFPNQILNAPVGVTTAFGRVDFTAQIIPLANPSAPDLTTPITSGVSPNWPALSPLDCSPIFVPGDADGDTDGFGAEGPMIYTVTAPRQLLVPVTVNAPCIARLPVGVYKAAIIFTNTPNTPGLPGVATPTIPIIINVGTAPIAGPPETIILGDSKVSQQEALALANPLGPNGGPYSYTVGYVPNNTVGTALPIQYVTIVSGATGIIPNGGQAQVVVQINPCPAGLPCLPVGVYSGLLLSSNNGQASGATPQTTTALIVFVGGNPTTDPGGTGPGLGLMLPPNSLPIGDALLPHLAGNSLGAYPLTFSIPAGYSPRDVLKGQLGRPVIFEITGLANTRSTAYQVATPTIGTFNPPLPGGTLTFDPQGACNTWAGKSILPSTEAGQTCFYSMEIDSTLLSATNAGACPLGTPGTAPNVLSCYVGSITWSPVAGTTAFRPLTVPVTLNVTGFPQLVVTEPIFTPFTISDQTLGAQTRITGIPLPTVNGLPTIELNGTIGNSTLSCQVIDISTNGGLITNVTIAPMTSSWISLAIAPAQFLPPIPGVFSGFGFGQFDDFGIPGQNGQYAAGPITVGPGLQTLEVCADPSKLVGVPATGFNPPGSFVGSITINGGGVGPIVIQVIFSPVGIGAPGQPPVTTRSSQIGVFRPPTPVGGALGFFTLDSNGNYAFDGPLAAGVVLCGAAGQPNCPDKVRQFGLAGDVPVAGDWTGSGVVRLGVFRCPAVGICSWYLDLNNNGVWDGTFGGDTVFQFGLAGDTPVVGDWTGTGVTKVGVMRCPAGAGVCTWYLDAGNTRLPSDPTNLIYSYGLAGDKPAVGNWSGVVAGNSPVDQIGVFRNGLWIVDSNGDGQWEPTDAQFNFGIAGDIPVVGNWNGTGAKRIGVFRNGVWYLDTNGNGQFDATDQIVSFGLPGDKPVVGFFTVL